MKGFKGTIISTIIGFVFGYIFNDLKVYSLLGFTIGLTYDNYHRNKRNNNKWGHEPLFIKFVN